MIAAGFLDGLDAARAKATPGPWVHEHDDYGDEWWFGGDHGGGQEVVAGHIVTGSDHAADAALIVAAVNALPELTAAVRAMEAVLDEWEKTSNPVLPRGLVVAVLRGVLADALAGDS